MSSPGAMKTCLVSTLRWSCIILISNRMLNRLGSNNDSFDPTFWRRSKLKLTNSLNVASFERNNTQSGSLTLCLLLKRTKRSASILTSVILIQPVLKTNFHYPSMTSWLTKYVVSKGYFYGWLLRVQPNQDIPRWQKAYIIPNTIGSVLLHGNAMWLEECRRNLPTCNEHNLLWSPRKMVECYVEKSRSKVAIRTTISTTWGWCSISCGLTSLRWIQQSLFGSFIVTSKGIHIHPSKIKTIQAMQPSRNLKELRGLQGRLAYIWRFVANLSGRC